MVWLVDGSEPQCYASRMARYRFLLGTAATILVAACTAEDRSCSGFEINSPQDTTFTVPQLMAHAAAMGMTQQEAETLIYLEGITSVTSVEGGSSLCIDGKPDP